MIDLLAYEVKDSGIYFNTLCRVFTGWVISAIVWTKVFILAPCWLLVNYGTPTAAKT